MLAATMGPELIPVFMLVFVFLVVLPVALVLTAFWIWMLICAVQNKGLTEGEKIAWVLILVFVHFLGAILYYFIGHPKRNTPLPPPTKP